MKRSGAGVGDDHIIVLIASDDESTLGGWLHSLPRDEPPIELPAPVAELLADWRREAE
jgi:hypothetical protein